MQSFHLMNFTILKQIMVMRKMTLYAVVFLCAVAISSQLFMSLYQNPKMEKLQAEWMRLRELEGRGAILRDRVSLYGNGISDLARFRARVYPKSQFARYIGEFYDLGAKNGLEIDTITYKPTLNKDEKLLSYALTMSVSGKYGQLKKYIYDLGSNGNIQVINSISMLANNSEIVQLQLQMTSYFTMEVR